MASSKKLVPVLPATPIMRLLPGAFATKVFMMGLVLYVLVPRLNMLPSELQPRVNTSGSLALVVTSYLSQQLTLTPLLGVMGVNSQLHILGEPAVVDSNPPFCTMLH